MATIIHFKQVAPILGRLGNQSHKAHLMYVKTFRDRINTNVIESLGANCPQLISTAFTAYNAAVNHEDQVAIVIQKSQHTEEIVNADDVRDNTWVGAKTMAEALQRVGTEAQKQAAKVFLDSAASHKIGISQKYEVETESIRQFIQLCEGSLATHVATLGLTALIAQLKQENEAVHTLIQQRNTEAAGIDTTAMQSAREDVDALYKQLVQIINAFAIATWQQGASPYDTCIDLVNADIDYYDRHVFSKKKKDDGTSGGGSNSGNGSNGGSDNNAGDDNGGSGDNNGGSGDNNGGSGDNNGGSGDNNGGNGDNNGGSGDNNGGNGDNNGGSGDDNGGSGDNNGGSGGNEPIHEDGD